MKRALRAAFGSVASRRNAPAGDSSLPPERVCSIQGEIARGGMGVVYRAHDVALRRDVALKLLREELASDSAAVERFLEEARIAGALQHPGIVPIYALGRTETGRPYFTMKLIEGRTLASLLAERTSAAHDQRRFLAILDAACRTVAYAHDRGIVHLDLKPGNVMVGSFGEVQVVDWGLAVLAQRSPEGRTHPPASSGSVYGTPAYMPPEQARGESARIDTRADVFALGAMLCEMLVGEPPYAGGRGATRRDAADAKLGDSLARLRAVEPRELAILCERCLAAQPEQRDVTASGIASAIARSFAVLEERARAAEIAAAEAQARATQERRARRLTIALTATVLASILVGGAVWGWLAHERERSRASIESRARVAIEEAAGFLGGAESSADVDLYGKAASAAERAKTLLAGTDANPELDRSATAILERSLKQQETARAMLETRRIDRELFARTDAIRVSAVEATRAPDLAELDRRYAQAFHAAGLDPETDPDGFVARTIERGIGVDVAAALDDWSDVRETACLLTEADRLRALAPRIDPEPIRIRARELIAHGIPDDVAGWIDAGGIARSRPSTALAMADSIAERFDGQALLLLRIYRAAQLAHPQDYPVAISLAQMLFTIVATQHAEGEHFYRVAQALRPDLADPLLCLGWELEHRNIDCAEAAELDRRAVELEPENRATYYHLARALRCIGDFEGSLAAMTRAAELRGYDSTVFHQEIASSYRMAHRYDEALAEYRKILEVHPRLGVVRYECARTLLDTGRVDDALSEMEVAIVDDPEARALLLSTKACMLLERGDGDKAARVLHESPDAQVEAILPLREMDARLADYLDLEPLIATCSRQIEREPEDAQALCRLGALLEASGRFGEALVAYRVGHALGTRQQGWSHPSAAWVDGARRLASLESCADSNSKNCEPRDAREAIDLAVVTSRRGSSLLAAQRFMRAFEMEPTGATVDSARLEAACAAVASADTSRVADGGADGDRSPGELRRARALEWMKADLLCRRLGIENGDPRRELRALAAWRAARELASVRDENLLGDLAPADHAAWSRAWSELDALATQTRNACLRAK
jgi:serine/threonine-protein kinase